MLVTERYAVSQRFFTHAIQLCFDFKPASARGNAHDNNAVSDRFSIKRRVNEALSDTYKLIGANQKEQRRRDSVSSSLSLKNT